MLIDLISRLFSGLLTDLGISSGSKSARKLLAKNDLGLCAVLKQNSFIGIHGDELNASHTGLDHTVNCVVSASANSYYDDLCVFPCFAIIFNAQGKTPLVQQNVLHIIYYNNFFFFARTIFMLFS